MTQPLSMPQVCAWSPFTLNQIPIGRRVAKLLGGGSQTTTLRAPNVREWGVRQAGIGLCVLGSLYLGERGPQTSARCCEAAPLHSAAL